jgi:hypothetical protein
MNYKVNKLSQILGAVVITVLIIAFSSCEKNIYTPPQVNTADTIHFSTQVQPIFNASCVSCHGATKAPDLREGKSYAALTKGGYITPPGETSKLYTKMIGADHAPRSTDTDKQTVLIWINQGALNN